MFRYQVLKISFSACSVFLSALTQCQLLMLLKCEEFGTANLSLAGALALFSRDSESNLSSLETLNQMFLEYQAAHLKSGQTNDQLLLKPLLYITFSFPFHEVKTSCIYSVLSTEFLCCMPMSLKVYCLVILNTHTTESLQACQLPHLGCSTPPKCTCSLQNVFSVWL